jgi:hypothetical protein
MSDDEKPVDLEEFKRRRAMAYNDEAYEELGKSVCEDLCALWDRLADESRKLQRPKSADSIFYFMSSVLILLAQKHQVDNDLIIICLLLSALEDCKPKDKVYELIVHAGALMTGVRLQ